MTAPQMTMTDAANRLKILAESYHAGNVDSEPDEEGNSYYTVSKTELEAVTTAAAILGMFVEALEDTTT